jgi:hypothetical protein
VRYAPRTCYLYKLGALWGYAGLVLATLPDERAPYAPELRHYALASELPLPLWQPMLDPPAGTRVRDTYKAIERHLTDEAERAISTARAHEQPGITLQGTSATGH